MELFSMGSLQIIVPQNTSIIESTPQADLHTTFQWHISVKGVAETTIYTSSVPCKTALSSPLLHSPFSSLGREMSPQHIARESGEGTIWLPLRRDI